MSSAKASLAPGKQSPRRVGSRTSAYAVADSAGHYTSEQSLRSIAWLENGGSWTLSMPQAAESPLYFAFCCFPPASPPLPPGPGKQKTAPKDRCNPMIFLMKSGAGEGIRTLDPNLGKVVIGSRSRKHRGYNQVRTLRSPFSLTASKQLLIAFETALSPGSCFIAH